MTQAQFSPPKVGRRENMNAGRVTAKAEGPSLEPGLPVRPPSTPRLNAWRTGPPVPFLLAAAMGYGSLKLAEVIQ
jgi:hypothetical protein